MLASDGEGEGDAGKSTQRSSSSNCAVECRSWADLIQLYHEQINSHSEEQKEGRL